MYRLQGEGGEAEGCQGPHREEDPQPGGEGKDGEDVGSIVVI